MTGRIFVGGVVGGVALFLWGALSHTVLGLGESALKRIPNEDAALAMLKTNLTEPGFYFFPYMKESPDMTKEQKETAMKAWDEKYRAGPRGVLVFQPRGEQAMSPGQLLTQFAIDLSASLVTALLLASASGLSSYVARVLFVGLLGLLPCLIINLPYWNWYGFPTDFTLVELSDKVIGFVLAGLVLAAIVKRPAPTHESPSQQVVVGDPST